MKQAIRHFVIEKAREVFESKGFSATTVEDIATIMVNRNFHTIPVLEEGKLVGIIGKADILQTIIP